VTITSCRVHAQNDQIHSQICELPIAELMPEAVLIEVAYSGINYKDALGVTGKGKIYKQLPINAGIDCAGTIESSEQPHLVKGMQVLVNGCGLGEVRDGGLAQKVYVPSDWVIPLPGGLTARDAMIFGTAGFTAALAIDRMQQLDQTADLGPIVVTGASGGVGSFAVMMLSSLGFETIAVTSRTEHTAYLESLGAHQVCTTEQLELETKPLAKARFGGVIDNVGGEMLASLLPHVNLWGNVASIGLAASPKLATSVFPFILRGVSILGISSTNCPMTRRKAVWQRMASEFVDRQKLDLILDKEVPLTESLPYFDGLINRQYRGRILVNCQR
jgi:acrylyl-CoA reductase (NADPH)